MYLIMFIFYNNLINYIHFYDKKMCLFLNAFMPMHGLQVSIYLKSKLRENPIRFQIRA